MKYQILFCVCGGGGGGGGGAGAGAGGGGGNTDLWSAELAQRVVKVKSQTSCRIKGRILSLLSQTITILNKYNT